jgi:hypothetical protein
LPQPVLTDMTKRLQACRAEVQDAREVLNAALRRRDAVIVDAIDEGMAQRAVAEHAGVSNTRVVAVLADSQPDAVLPR